MKYSTIDEINLEPGQWEHIPAFHKVTTGELGPCIGVIIYSRKLKQAYAAHILDVQEDNLEQMVRTAVKTFAMEQVEAYVAGGVIDDDDEASFKMYMESERKQVIDILRPFNQKHIRWNPPNSSSSLVLYTWNGRNIYTLTDLSQDVPQILYQGKIQDAPLRR